MKGLIRQSGWKEVHWSRKPIQRESINFPSIPSQEQGSRSCMQLQPGMSIPRYPFTKYKQPFGKKASPHTLLPAYTGLSPAVFSHPNHSSNERDPGFSMLSGGAETQETHVSLIHAAVWRRQETAQDDPAVSHSYQRSPP